MNDVQYYDLFCILNSLNPIFPPSHCTNPAYFLYYYFIRFAIDEAMPGMYSEIYLFVLYFHESVIRVQIFFST